MTTLEETATLLAERFAYGWEIAGMDWPAAWAEPGTVTIHPGGHDAFIVPEGFGSERLAYSLVVWLSAADERQSLTDFYRMAEEFSAVARAFSGPGLSGLKLERVLEPRIVNLPTGAAAFVGQFDIYLHRSTC